jgi:hypothetical protein
VLRTHAGATANALLIGWTPFNMVSAWTARSILLKRASAAQVFFFQQLVNS